MVAEKELESTLTVPNKHLQLRLPVRHLHTTSLSTTITVFSSLRSDYIFDVIGLVYLALVCGD